MVIKNSEFFIGTDLQWESFGEGISRQMLGYDNHIMMVKLKFITGAVGEIHQQFQSQSTYFISGQFEVNIGGEKKNLKAGDAYYVAPNILHGIVCLDAGALITVFNPARKDI